VDTAIWILIGVAIVLAVFAKRQPKDQDPDAWRSDPATQKQLDYIESLSGEEAPRGLTKGQASALIDRLLEEDD